MPKIPNASEAESSGHGIGRFAIRGPALRREAAGAMGSLFREARRR